MRDRYSHCMKDVIQLLLLPFSSLTSLPDYFCFVSKRDTGIYLCTHKSSSSSDFIRGNDRQKGQRAALFPSHEKQFNGRHSDKDTRILGIRTTRALLFQICMRTDGRNCRVFYLSVCGELHFLLPLNEHWRSASDGYYLTLELEKTENLRCCNDWPERETKEATAPPVRAFVVSATAFLSDYNLAVD